MVALGCKKCASEAGPPSPEKPGDACTPAIVVMVCALVRRAKRQKKRIKKFLMIKGFKEGQKSRTKSSTHEGYCTKFRGDSILAMHTITVPKSGHTAELEEPDRHSLTEERLLNHQHF